MVILRNLPISVAWGYGGPILILNTQGPRGGGGGGNNDSASVSDILLWNFKDGVSILDSLENFIPYIVIL